MHAVSVYRVLHVFALMSTMNSSFSLTLLHSERPKLYAILAFLSAVGLIQGDTILFKTFGIHTFSCIVR